MGCPRGHALTSIYASQLFYVIESYLPDAHAYADDTQLYISFNPNILTDTEIAFSAIEPCINDLRSLMIKNRLIFNDSKTELLLLGTPRELQKITCNTSITLGESLYKPADVVQDLGAWFDQNLSMKTHVCKISAVSATENALPILALNPKLLLILHLCVPHLLSGTISLLTSILVPQLNYSSPN